MWSGKEPVRRRRPAKTNHHSENDPIADDYHNRGTTEPVANSIADPQHHDRHIYCKPRDHQGPDPVADSSADRTPDLFSYDYHNRGTAEPVANSIADPQHDHDRHIYCKPRDHQEPDPVANSKADAPHDSHDHDHDGPRDHQ